MKPTTFKAIQTFKVMDCSTSHVTDEEINDLLERDDCPVPNFPYEYGNFVYVTNEQNPDDERAIRDFGFSESFIKLLRIARENGCRYIALDCDGLVYEDLQTYDW